MMAAVVRLVVLTLSAAAQIHLSALPPVGGQGGVVYSASAEGEDVLQNGLVRIVFNRHNGQFELRSLPAGRVMRLYDAGPAFSKDG